MNIVFSMLHGCGRLCGVVGQWLLFIGNGSEETAVT
jgi:hypothetical protein